MTLDTEAEDTDADARGRDRGRRRRQRQSRGRPDARRQTRGADARRRGMTLMPGRKTSSLVALTLLTPMLPTNVVDVANKSKCSFFVLVLAMPKHASVWFRVHPVAHSSDAVAVHYGGALGDALWRRRIM